MVFRHFKIAVRIKPYTDILNTKRNHKLNEIQEPSICIHLYSSKYIIQRADFFVDFDNYGKSLIYTSDSYMI